MEYPILRARKRTLLGIRYWDWLLVIGLTLMIFGTSFAVLQARYVQGERQLKQVEAYRNELFLKVDELSERLAYAHHNDV